MAMAGQFAVEENIGTIPATMQAAVYRGVDDVRLETVPVPQIGPSELLLRVHTCGICGTDLKKIATGSHSVPRIFGHETAGVVAAVGAGVHEFHSGDRVVVFHHVPCRDCFYCRRKTFAQCETYKKVGCTAGFEPSGGGFAEFVRVMDWIVRQGTVRIPANVSFEQACFLEPINTCMKGIERLALQPGETVVVIGQGPIGIMLSVLAKRAMTAGVGGDFYSHIGARSGSSATADTRAHIELERAEVNGSMVVTSDLYPQRLTISTSYGLGNSIDASRTDVVKAVRELTDGRGADAAILAVGGNGLIRTAMDAVRPGGRVLLFAQTVHGEATFDPGAVCVDEKALLGSYSASVDLQEESVQFVFRGAMEFERLISHRFPLVQSVEALRVAAHPQPDSLKVVVQPGSAWEGQVK